MPPKIDSRRGVGRSTAGSDYSEMEINFFKNRVQEAKKTGADVRYSFRLEGEKKCRKFNEGHAVDESTGRLYNGKCECGFEAGSPCFTLAKTSQADQNLAYDYCVKNLVATPKLLREVVSINTSTAYGAKQLAVKVKTMLRDRFDLSPHPFINEGAKGEWDLNHLRALAQSHMAVFGYQLNLNQIPDLNVTLKLN